MKNFIPTILLLSSISLSIARDPGTGSNTTIGPRPVAFNAASQDASM